MGESPAQPDKGEPRSGYSPEYQSSPMTPKSQSRNASCIPFRGRGPRSGEGWTVVRMIMIFLFYVLSPFAQGAADWRSGPRWSILLVLCPVHPFPLRGTSPQGETRDMREKQRVIYFMYHSGVSPFGGCRHYLARWEACHMTQKVNPATLTLYSSPAGRYHNPRPERPSNLRTLRPSGRSILRTFLPAP